MSENEADVARDSTPPEPSLVIRRGARSEEQRGARQRSVQETVAVLQRDVLRCGCGQVLAFLESRAGEEPYQSIRNKLVSTLGIEADEGKTVAYFSTLNSFAAIEFKQRLLDALNTLIQEQQ